ncbi:phosphoglycerate kinase [Candidatus Microgenomates bacterium]|nr:phosphoglycerate kinase [Candidatus Microgenomates bacterium]
MILPTIDQVEVTGKRVFVRGDIDVPLDPSAPLGISDDRRLRDILPTIEFLLKQNCTVLLAGHLGRPGGKEDPALSSKPVAEWFATRLRQGSGEARGVCLKGNICGFAVGKDVVVLENLRFDPREEANDEGFAKELASLADIYVDEAFGTCYENHVSIAGVPKFLPHFAGLRLAKEVEVLSGVLEKPKRPLLVIVGGAKVDTKIPVIAKMQAFADKVLLGGKIVTEVFSYAREQGVELDRNKVLAFPLTADFKDIFPQAIYDAREDFWRAGTIVWNGPFGRVEEEQWQAGTEKVIDLILQNKTAYKVVGGGDTIGFLDKLGLIDKFDWVSSGGGSMLKFLAGEKLPGIEVLVS